MLRIGKQYGDIHWDVERPNMKYNVEQVLGAIILKDGRRIKPKNGVKVSLMGGKWYVDGVETKVEDIPTT